MKLYEIYVRLKDYPGGEGYRWVVAHDKTEAMEILFLLTGVDLNYNLKHLHDFAIEKITAINPAEGGYINCKKLTKNWNTGYFDFTQGKTFGHRKNKHWYPFVEFTVRGYYIDQALQDLDMSE